MSTPHRAELETLALLLLGAAVFLPALGQETRLMSREVRHAELARVMVETREYAVPRLFGRPYTDKPPLFNWTAASLFVATGRTDLAVARMPSVLSAIAAALAVYALGARWMGGRAGFWSGIVWLSSWMVVEWARASRMDMMMACLTVWSILLADVAAVAHRPLVRWTAWCGASILTGMAVLSKGPVPLFIFLGAVAIIWRARKRRWSPSLAALIVAALLILAPFAAWSVAAERSHPGHLARLLGYQFGEGVVQHSKRFTLYFEQLILLTLPWSVFAVGAFRWSWKKFRAEGFGIQLAPAVLTAVVLAVMTCVPNKRPHYLLPMLPLWSILLGGFIDRAIAARSAAGAAAADSPPKWALDRPLRGALVGVCVAAAATCVYVAAFSRVNVAASAAFLVPASAASAAGLVFALRKRLEAAFTLLAASTIAVMASAYPALMPSMHRESPETPAAREAAAVVPAGVAVADYKVLNEYLCFKLARPIAWPADVTEVAGFLEGAGPRCAIVGLDDETAVRGASTRPLRCLGSWDVEGLRMVVLETSGVNVAKGSGAASRPQE